MSYRIRGLLPDGFNMSVWGDRVLFRTQELLKRVGYPTVRNRLYTGRLLTSDRVVDVAELVEDPRTRTLCINYTEGVEDARLFREDRALAVTLDTNAHFRIEMSLLLLDQAERRIRSIIPIVIQDHPIRRAEKNWIILHDDVFLEEADVLYSLSPRTVILRLDVLLGKAMMVCSHPASILTMLGLAEEKYALHNGAMVRLPSGRSIVTARIKDDTGYLDSLWVLLDTKKEGYHPISVSPRFRFFPGQHHFEMCMSLVLVPHHNHEDASSSRYTSDVNLLAYVSIDDREVFCVPQELHPDQWKSIRP